jgi:hypothetical protein
MADYCFNMMALFAHSVTLTAVHKKKYWKKTIDALALLMAEPRRAHNYPVVSEMVCKSHLWVANPPLLLSCLTCFQRLSQFAATGADWYATGVATCPFAGACFQSHSWPPGHSPCDSSRKRSSPP